MQKKLFSTTFGQGPSLVFLHGWGFHSGVLRPISDKLSEQFQVTLVDLPGYGRSQHIAFGDEINTVVNQVLDVVPEQAFWLGWSLGGLIAQYIGIHHPDRVKKLITVASSPYFMQAKDWPGMQSTTLHMFSDQLINDYETTLMNFLLLQFNDPTVNKSLIKWLKDAMFQFSKPSLATLQSGLKVLESLDLRPYIAKLFQPTLFMLGRLDTLAPIGLAKSIGQKNANIQFHIFLKASHAPFLSHPDEFLHKVESFLND